MMMIAMAKTKSCLLLFVFLSTVLAFSPVGRHHGTTTSRLEAAESEVSFDTATLDGSNMRFGIIRTRWNEKHVDNLTKACRQSLLDLKVDEENIFETSVPGSFELPMAARFLALSGTVDAIICIGVLIKGETMHFEYISDAVTKGLMNIGISTSTPVILGVLTCLTEEQVVARSSGSSNHGSDWGKTAVEMALLRTEAMGGKTAADSAPLKDLGFGKKDTPAETKKDKTKQPGFF